MIVGNFHKEQYRINRRGIIRQLSAYSKDKEFEADDLGFKRYIKTNYDPMQSLSSMKILEYSQ